MVSGTRKGSAAKIARPSHWGRPRRKYASVATTRRPSTGPAPATAGRLEIWSRRRGQTSGSSAIPASTIAATIVRARARGTSMISAADAAPAAPRLAAPSTKDSTVKGAEASGSGGDVGRSGRAATLPRDVRTAPDGPDGPDRRGRRSGAGRARRPALRPVVPQLRHALRPAVGARSDPRVHARVHGRFRPHPAPAVDGDRRADPDRRRPRAGADARGRADRVRVTGLPGLPARQGGGQRVGRVR